MAHKSPEDHKAYSDVFPDEPELTPNQRMILDGIENVLRLLVTELRRREPKESAMNIVNEVKRRANEFYGGAFWSDLFGRFNLKAAIAKIAENIFDRITREPNGACDPLGDEK